jgi:poly(A) polymerase
MMEPKTPWVGRKPENSEPARLLAQVVQLLREMGIPAYLVGGAVRDRLLNEGQEVGTESPRPYYDLDFAVAGDGLRIARRIADALGGAFYPLDAGRGVGRVVFSGSQGEVRVVDVARFQGPDLRADLAGRDFTVNAMALDVTRDPFDLIDLHGGQADLQARRLRAVSDEALRNDPVRGLRAVRQAAELGFEIELCTQDLIREAAPGLAGVSAERMRDELAKILSLPGTTASLRQLDGLYLLAEILPEVTALKDVAQTRPHRWDAYEHTLQTVAALESLLPLDGSALDPELPFPEQVTHHLAQGVTGGHSRRLLLTLAALLHDVGKRDTARVEADGRVRFIGHDKKGATKAAKAMRRLRFATDATRRVESIVRYHLRPLQLAWQGSVSKRAIYRFFRDAGDAGVDTALLALADQRATTGPDAGEEQYAPLLETVGTLLDAYFNQPGRVVMPPPLLTGRDLMRQFGLSEGPEIGRLLAALREAQAVGQVTDREGAEAWLKREIRNQGIRESGNQESGEQGSGNQGSGDQGVRGSRDR